MTLSRPATIGLAAGGACLLGLLVWGAAAVLRDPLAELPPLEQARAVAHPRIEAAPEGSPAAAPRPQGPDYVGSDACASCHDEISRSYLSHPMSRSVSLASAGPAGEQPQTSAPFSGAWASETGLRFAYHVSTREGDVAHHEAVLDAAGNELCRRTVPVHYAIGSGERAHSYLTDAGGELFMSPITWYAGTQDWGFSPGYETTNEHFGRRVLDGCVFCHVGRASPAAGRVHTFAERPFAELSIGCERCHGPGGDHVAFHEGSGERDRIVNPQRLPQPLRDDVCFQCHLVGVERVPHPGRRDFEYRPGQALSDLWTVLMQPAQVSQDGTTQAVGQARQMLLSRCYVGSGGAMSCTSCHDPHSSPTEAGRVAYYRSKCLQCHQSEAGSAGCGLPPAERRAVSAEDSCIECHMPQRDASDVPHTSQTDHRVVRHRPGTDTPAGSEELVAYQADRLSPAIVERARGITLTHQAEATADRLLAQRVISLLGPWVGAHPDDDVAVSALGTAYFLTHDTRNALLRLEQALASNPDSEYALRQLMFLCHDVGDLEQGIEYARRLLEINPHDYEYQGRMAHMLGRAGRWDDAIAAAQQAAGIRPWSPQIHGWLAEAYRITDQQSLAQAHRELFEKLNPRKDDPQQ